MSIAACVIATSGSTLGLPPAAAAPDAGPTIMQVRVGFGGKYKLGHWTPVAVVLRGGRQPARGALSLELLDGDGEPSRVQWDADRPVRIEPKTRRTITALAKFGRVHSGLRVVFRTENGRQISRRMTADELPPPLPSAGRLVATIGSPMGAEQAAARLENESAESIAIVRVQHVAELPDQWLGYDGLDAVVLATSDVEPYRQLSHDQLGALEQWIELGGRLLLSVGVNGRELLAKEGKLRRLAPGRFARILQRPPTAQLQSLAGAAAREGAMRTREDISWSMTLLQNVRGRIEVDEGDKARSRPVLIRAPLGLGQIVFSAVDLDAEPFLSWPGRDRVVGYLLQLLLGQRETSRFDPRHRQVAHVGYRDLAGQLRAALDRFPGVLLMPFSLVAALAVLYIAAIGPLDYFVLRKFVGNTQWTWLTFPLTVVLFGAMAYGLACYGKGNRLGANQVDLVDVDLASGWVRGTTWIHLYSPRAETYDLTLQPAWPSSCDRARRGAVLSWQGLPGRSFGGMDSSAISLSPNDVYTMRGRRTASGGWRVDIEQLPIATWSSRSLIGRWWCQSPGDSTQRLAAKPDGQLQGRLRNPLPVDLNDCLLVHDGWAYPLGRLEARGQRSVDQLGTLLENVLIRRKVDLGRMENVVTPWDPRSVEVPRIMQIIMLYKAAGGRSYTKLLHRYQGSLDLSDHLTVGRAVLIGRSDQPAGTLQQDGKSLQGRGTKYGTFYRIVFPVDST